MKTNSARWFQRREDYPPPFTSARQAQPRQTPKDSPFRQFDVKCLACGSYQLRLVAEFDDQAGQMSVVLCCTHCPQREIMPIR